MVRRKLHYVSKSDAHIVQKHAPGKVPMMRYYLNQSANSFQAINEFDPEFFPTLARAFMDPKMDIWLQRMDVASDLRCDIMSLVRNALFTGRYKSNISQPYVWSNRV